MVSIKKRFLFILSFILCFFSFANNIYCYNLDLEKFKLNPLPYNYDALEPYIDKNTMFFHHDKHQKAYVDNLNKSLENYAELYSKGIDGLLTSLNKLPEDIKQSVINNAGGVYNHEFFWSIMCPEQGGKPIGNLSKEIDKTFKSFENFKNKFKESGINRFGSGWVWLVKNTDNKISIISTSNQDCPISQGLTPIIGLDLWEHSYYLKYQNRRGEYIDNWWNLVNWEQAEKNYNVK
ncbi:superoxide dismutase [Clostridium tarantellae]|uniref:Superoxide dismutase n=1 Tax=Clostridium tarantellae TaxID=39493 RepID=A0A6I1MKG3_9CLOT|nr:superoxide dismutase [Clostridium tarantellae]MPQ42672.1 superoxide dismutase [Clostridium tarantellae]